MARMAALLFLRLAAATALWSLQAAHAVAQVKSHTPEVAAICERAAEVASAESGVPLDVLRAIFLTETGRRIGGQMQPWPWTVNMEGAGQWFDDRDAALEYVRRHMQRGARSFDVGCFQINYRWHGKAFSSVEEMFDPLLNARYAARFLSELYGEFGNWTRAAGAYHSRTPEFARRYEARFQRFREAMGIPPRTESPLRISDETVVVAGEPAPRVNLFPLLVESRGGGTLASLVPLVPEAGNGRFILMSRQ